MRSKFIFLPILGIVMGLFTALCLWNAFSDFRAAANMRHTKAKVLASRLKMDWGRADATSYEEPLYTVEMDLVATDGSNRTFHWEGDPGQAVYPEEALDALQRWAPGTEHTVSMLRGNARELRFDQFESNPEIGKGIAWMVGAMFAGITGLAAFAAGDRLNILGPWAVFVGFGLFPLLGAFPVAWGTSQKILNWKQVTAQKIGDSAPFDVSKPIPNVVLTPKAIENLPTVPYDRFEFTLNGATFHAGRGPWHGVYETALADDKPVFFVDPNDRWSSAKTLSWQEDFGVPTGILLFFGLTFTGVGLLIRKFDRRF